MNPDTILLHAKYYGRQYLAAVEHLLINLEGKNENQKCDLFGEFAEKYTMIPMLWVEWYKIEWQKRNEWHKFKVINYLMFTNLSCEEVISFFTDRGNTSTVTSHEQKKKHYYTDYKDDKMENIFGLAKDFVKIKRLRDMLSYPHVGLPRLADAFQKCYRDELSTSPKQLILPRYKKAENLTETLKIIERNEELWIKYLSEVEDPDFIIASCEYRLGQKPEDQAFWIPYLKYLKESNQIQLMLDTYSRYCRLFLDDSDMVKKYYDEIGEAKLKFRQKWWIDYVKILERNTDEKECVEIMKEILRKNYNMQISWKSREDDFGQKFAKFVHNLKVCEGAADGNTVTYFGYIKNKFKNTVTVNVKKPKIPTVLCRARRQFFDFPKAIIDQILATAEPYIQMKLQQTCKFFYKTTTTVYCHRLVIADFQSLSTFIEHSFLTNPGYINQINLDNYNLCNSLEISSWAATTLLSSVTSRIKFCNLRHLKFENQSITFKEFQFLTNSNTLENVQLLKFVIINDADNARVVPLETILELLPNITQFKCVPSDAIIDGFYTRETAQKMLRLTFNQKIKFFYITEIPPIFIPNSLSTLADFVIKNASPDAKFAFKRLNRGEEESLKAAVNGIPGLGKVRINNFLGN